MEKLVGSIHSLWRYPVKSMMGEELSLVDVTERGLLGDRGYAIIDSADGKVASAKNPRKWPRLFEFRAELADAPGTRAELPRVRITLPDGAVVDSDQADVHRILSNALEREVTLGAILPGIRKLVESASLGLERGKGDEYWPDMEDFKSRATLRDFGLAEGTFFDSAFVHLLSTATLERLRMLYPQGRSEVRRFRPNLVVQTANGKKGFVENTWVGQSLAIGDSVRLAVTGLCRRCVMTALPQGDLPYDPGILRTATQYNRANVGAYASVIRGGAIRRGDSVRLD
jgi:hypothetical protein